MNYRNFVMLIRGLRLLACLGLFSFIALVDDEYRLNFQFCYTFHLLFNNKYERDKTRI